MDFEGSWAAFKKLTEEVIYFDYFSIFCSFVVVVVVVVDDDVCLHSTCLHFFQ